MTNSRAIAAASICTIIRPEFRVPTDLFLLYAHDHSTKNVVLFHLIFLLPTTIQPIIRVRTDFFLSFLYTTIRQKYIALFNLFFLLCTTIGPKIKVHTDLFFMHTTIRPKVRVLINLFILFVYDHSTNN